MNKGSVTDGLVYHAGFPNAGEDRRDRSLSLDALVVKRRASTYFWRLESEVRELHWLAGTIVVVDRALSPREGRVVVVTVDEAFMLGRYHKNGFRDLDGQSFDGNVSLWGVVTYVLQQVNG